MLSHESTCTVVISMGKNNVSILKDEIMTRNPIALAHIDAKDLKLWLAKPNTSVGNLSSIDYPTDPELGNATLLSDLFQPVLNDQLVHVVAHVPARPGSLHISERAQVGMRNTVAALELSGCFLLFLTVPDIYGLQRLKKPAMTLRKLSKALSSSARTPTYPSSRSLYPVDGWLRQFSFPLLPLPTLPVSPPLYTA